MSFYLWLRGIILYHFLPNKTFDPFMSIELATISSKYDFTYDNGTTYSDNESDSGYSFSVGTQINIKNKVFIRPAITYSKLADYNSTIITSLKIDVKLTDRFYIGGKIEFKDDYKDEEYQDSEEDTFSTFYGISITGKF